MSDSVQEFIDRQNADRAGKPNPLVRTQRIEQLRAQIPEEDTVARYIRLRNMAAAARPNPFMPQSVV